MSLNGGTDNGTKYSPFSAFSLIWACTTFLHQLAFTFWTESWQGWVLVITAIACVFYPGCVLRLGMLAIASLLNLWHKLPFVPNHILFEGMLHIIMLIALVSFFLSTEGKAAFAESRQLWLSRFTMLLAAIAVKAAYFLIPGIPHGYIPGALTTLFLLFAICRFLFHEGKVGRGDVFFSSFAPVFRVAMLIMYLWAATQKLNFDYLDPDHSCASRLHIEIGNYFGHLIPTQRWALCLAIYASLTFEIGIPILLFFRRTRLIGFAAAVWFHMWLSIHQAAGIFSFSSLVIAMLFVFFPSTWGERLQEIWDRQMMWLGKGNLDRGRLLTRRIVVGTFFATLITQGMLYLLIERSYEVFHTANRIGYFTFFTWGCWLCACYLAAAWQGRKESAALPNRFRLNPACIGLILVLANGAFPWIGSRTQTSFSMYSNLRSEGEGNHVFLKRVDLFKYQTDMVEVIESEPNIFLPGPKPRGIQQFANLGHRLIPYFEFRRLVSETPGDVRVHYTRNGEDLRLSRIDGKIEGDEQAFETLPLLQRKLMWFRRLKSLEGPMVCTH